MVDTARQGLSDVPVQVAVCGPSQSQSHCSDRDRTHAYEVGRLLARRGVVVICGGGTGVMAAVAAGVRAENGLVIGVVPGDSMADACADLSAVIVTNMGEARNAIIVRSADALIAIGGSWGTLSEITLAKRRGGVPVVTLGGWSIFDAQGEPIADAALVAHDPAHAVDLALGR